MPVTFPSHKTQVVSIGGKNYYSDEYREFLNSKCYPQLSAYAEELGVEVEKFDENKFYASLFGKTTTFACVSDITYTFFTSQVTRVIYNLHQGRTFVHWTGDFNNALCENCRWIVHPEQTPLSERLRTLIQ